MNGRKRTVQLKFRVTEAERDLILEKMKLIPTRNMAAYLRKIAIDGYIIQIDHSDIKAMTAEIQKIGVNVNQIARRVNSTGSVYQEDKLFSLALHKAGFDQLFNHGGAGSGSAKPPAFCVRVGVRASGAFHSRKQACFRVRLRGLRVVRRNSCGWAVKALSLGKGRHI